VEFIVNDGSYFAYAALVNTHLIL